MGPTRPNNQLEENYKRVPPSIFSKSDKPNGIETLQPTLKDLLKEIKLELTEREKVREAIHDQMRKATSLSKQAILLSHQNRLNEASKKLTKAKELICKLQDFARLWRNVWCNIAGVF
jgi:hypothetical protein